MRRPWDRLLWGVEFYSVGDPPRDRLTILGTGWSHVRAGDYAGEPTRPLLFMTRADARHWCAKKLATYAGRTDRRAAWRFRPIRVRETVTRHRSKAKP